jgi:hypothetical protein
VTSANALEAQQRAEGEFLRQLVRMLQPMLRESMRSRRIFLAFDAYGGVALTSDGVFVHVGRAYQEDVLNPLQVLRAEPNLMAILRRIEAELVAGGDEPGVSAADIVRLARYSLASTVASA